MFDESSENVVADTYRHDLRNDLAVMAGAIRLASEGGEDNLGFSHLSSEEKEEFEEFAGIAWSASERVSATDDLGFVEEEIQQLAEFEISVKGKPGSYMSRISDLSEYVNNYISENGERSFFGEIISLSDVLEPFESEGSEINYNDTFMESVFRKAKHAFGFDETVYGDRGLCLAANTICGNWRQHGQNQEGESELYVEVEELEDEYKLGIWDNGPGLQGEDPEEIFESSNGGIGLPLAREITEMFDGSLEYSDEYASREGGFGLEWRLQKYG